MNPSLPQANRSRATWLWRGVSFVGALVLLRWLLVGHEETIRAYSPGCVFHRLTGWHCPGCGATRATFALLKGDVGTAWRMNPLYVVMLATAGLLVTGLIIEKLSGRNFRWVHLGSRPLWILLAVLIVFTILRNIPVWPFNLLAPH